MATCLTVHAQNSTSGRYFLFSAMTVVSEASNYAVTNHYNGYVCTINVCYDSCSFKYQHVLDKCYNDHLQWEEKAWEELADHHIKTGVDPATQLMRSGTPASLKEEKEVEHALDAFYTEMILWNLGVGREAQVLVICLFEVYRNVEVKVSQQINN